MSSRAHAARAGAVALPEKPAETMPEKPAEAEKMVAKFAMVVRRGAPEAEAQ
jgi:hypothetical protein